MDTLQAVILAIIEGITEFLPVSSTGHMVLASTYFGIEHDEFTKLFTIVIQLGAILSVLVLYFKRFFQTFDFYLKILDRIYIFPINFHFIMYMGSSTSTSAARLSYRLSPLNLITCFYKQFRVMGI